MEFGGRVPPHNLKAEQSVLGSMILDKDAITDVAELIKEEDFYREAHRLIFNGILRLFDKNEPVDMVTLAAELTKMGEFDALGGVEYLSDLTNEGIITSNAKYYAKIVQEKSLLRKLISASSEIIEKGYDLEEADQLLDLAEQSIFNISQNKSREGLASIAEILVTTYENIEKAYSSDGTVTGLSTGFIDLDRKTSGLQRSDLILLAARPAMGKTAFALNLCQNVAMKNDASVAIFSLEMAKDQFVQRMLSSEAYVPIHNLKNGILEEDDWSSLTKAMAILGQAKIYVDDPPSLTVMEMRAQCRRLKMERGLDLVMVDYLQLMDGGGKHESRQQEISYISRSLKSLARELDCPVIALSQLSRAPELRADHRPILSDLRESGAIEQDADIVMFLYRDEYYFPESDKPGIGELIIAKHRSGETGSVEMAWLGEFTKFVNLEKMHYE